MRFNSEKCNIMEYILIVVLLTVIKVELGDCAPLVDESLESRLESPPVPDGDSIPLSGNAPTAYEENEPCKAQLRNEIEHCLQGFEEQRKVYEYPDLTTQQRNRLKSHFCRYVK